MWCIKLKPYGNSDYGKFEDFNIHICALSIPSNVYKIYGYHRMFINGLIVSDKCGEYTNDENTDYMSSDEPIKIKDLERINIGLELVILHIFDHNGDDIIDTETQNDDIKTSEIVNIRKYPMQSYEWKMILKDLDEIDYDQGFKSKIFYLFGFKWMFEFIPREECEDNDCPLNDYIRLRIYLCGIPPDVYTIVVIISCI